MKIIYDFGANNGDNIEYFLKKADRVVAVEANPALAAHIAERFAREVLEEKLFVVNRVLCEGPSRKMPFFVHKNSHVLSQLPEPTPEIRSQFDCVEVQSISASDVVATYGQPHYIKIDVEKCDQLILRELFAAGVRPEFVSAECHNFEVFALLVAAGGYDAFKLVDGAQVGEQFRDLSITGANGNERYSFPHHSAGPFGDDIPGPWVTSNNMFYVLANERLGWKDVHASLSRTPDASALPLSFSHLGVKDCLRLLPKVAYRTFRVRLSAITRGRFAKG